MTTKAHAFGAGNIPSIGMSESLQTTLEFKQKKKKAVLTAALQPRWKAPTGAMETSRSEWEILPQTTA